MSDAPYPTYTSAQPAGYVKKRRNPNACDLCRKRKIKCDSALMPGNRCSECVSYNCECVHSNQRKFSYRTNLLPRTFPSPVLSSSSSSDPSVTRGTSEETPALHPLVSTIIPLLPPGLSSAANSALAHVSSHILNIERQLSDLRASAASNSSIFTHTSDDSSPRSNTQDNEEEDGDGDDGTKKLVEQMSELQLQPLRGKMGKHFGPSSSMALVGMALKVLLESNTDPSIMQDFRGIRRPFFWNLLPWEVELQEDIPLHQFPPTSVMYDLFDLFFREINVLLPLLHKPSFLRSVQESKHILNPEFGEVVLGVCALASRWSDDPSVLLEGENLGHSAGWRWFRQIRLFRKVSCRTPSVYELQSNILCVLFLGGSSQPEIAWMLLGLGMRYAVEVGAHRRRDEHPSVDSELWKRAFWTLWSYEGLLSSFLGRPRATLSEEFDVDMPIECDDEYWEAEDPSQAFKQPEGKPSQLSAFVSFIKLIQILEHAQAQLFSLHAQKALMLGRLKAQDVVAQLDSELNEWHDSVPEHLQWENFQSLDVNAVNNLPFPAFNFYRQANLLQCAYHHIHILSHRPFIFLSKPDSPMFVSSWAVCTTGARASMRILKVWQPFMMVHFSLVVNAVITILEKWKVGKQGGVSAMLAREHVADCLRLAKKYENRWFGAGKMADVISELMYLDDLVSQSSSNSGSPASSSTQDNGNSTGKINPEDIFSLATTSYPTFDMDFLGRSFVSPEDDFAMIF